MMRLSTFLCFILTTTFVSGCAFDPESVDRTCFTADDCAVVTLPATCASCGDPWSIRVDEVARWNKTRPNSKPVCTATSLKPCVDVSSATAPTCDDGVCGFDYVETQ